MKNTLQVMLKSPINSQKFIESKVAIQNELHVLATENTEQEISFTVMEFENLPV